MNIKSYLRRRRYESMSKEDLRELGHGYNQELGTIDVEIIAFEELAREKFEESLKTPLARTESSGFHSLNYFKARSLRTKEEKIERLLDEIEGVLATKSQLSA